MIFFSNICKEYFPELFKIIYESQLKAKANLTSNWLENTFLNHILAPTINN